MTTVVPPINTVCAGWANERLASIKVATVRELAVMTSEPHSNQIKTLHLICLAFVSVY